MENIQLEDLVYTYPYQKAENFQTKITSKEEFRQVASDPSEPVPERGQLFKHQKYLLRLMRQYDDQMVIWRTGTGKSCGVIGVSEHYSDLAEALENIRKDVSSPYTRAYVLVKGPSLKNEFRNQLVCKCTNNKYITEKVLKANTERDQKAAITREIKSFYTIKTYGKFAKELSALSDDRLRQEYPGTIFIIDEAHNLKNSDEGYEKVDKNTGNIIHMKKVKRGGIEKEVIVEQRLIYNQLHRVFHILSHRKVMLLTATPMINDVSELTSLLNLLLPSNMQLPLELDWSNITLNDIEPYMRGLISYVRELDTGVVPIYNGTTLNKQYTINGRTVESQMTIYPSEMIGIQANTYKIAETDPRQLRPESDRPEAFATLYSQAANFVFPNGTTGSRGFKTYINKQPSGDYYANNELLEWISDENKLRQLSSKFHSIVKLTKELPGNTWCYSHFVVGSGAVLLGLCFEAQGFERYRETGSVFVTKGGTGIPPVCSSSSDKAKTKKIRINKRLRYAILTSDTSDPEAKSILETFNSYENRHGEYIKLVIGSKITRDGINLANVLNIHLTGPGWNLASMYQAESRAIRSTSHVDLISEERERLERLGQDPSEAKININIFRHAAINGDGRSIDTVMYSKAEDKDIEIKRVYRMMKQVATDCQINYNRNVRPNDIDGSSTCDYDICKYKCVDPSPTSIDYSSYDVLYTENIVKELSVNIKNYFRQKFRSSFEELYKIFNNHRPKFVDLAVTEIIENKERIINRYGYVSYLRESNGSLYLQRDFPLETYSEGDYNQYIYTESIIGIQKTPMNKFISKLQKNEQIGMIERLLTLNPNSVEFNKIFDELNLENKIELLESSIFQLFVNRKQSEAINAIINKYRSFVYQVKEPIRAIQITADALANRGKGRGRKPAPGSKFKLNKEQQEQVENTLDENGPGETIYMHTLYSLPKGITEYNVSARIAKAEGTIRILKISENAGWRDANKYEEPVYNTIVQKQKEEILSQFEQYKIYGILTTKGNKKIFRIRDKRDESEEASTDKRKRNRGKVCTTFNSEELLDLLWYFKIEPPYEIQELPSTNDMRQMLRKAKIKWKKDNVTNFSNEKVEFMYKWIRSGVHKTTLCRTLTSYFQKSNRLLVL